MDDHFSDRDVNNTIEQCGICGRLLDGSLRARYYPGDGTYLCERCFPFSNDERKDPAFEREEDPK